MPFPGGKIAPALLLRKDPQKVELPSGIIGVTGYSPTIESDVPPPPTNPPTWIDELSGHLSPVYAFGNTGAVPTAARTIDRSEFGSPSSGQFLVAVSLYPGYFGQSNPFLWQSGFSGAWANTTDNIFHTFSDTSESCGGIWVREASGDVNDTCIITSPGSYPSFTQIALVTGNPHQYPGSATADNESGQDLADAAGALMVGGMYGGYLNCIEFFASLKRGTAAQVTDPLIGPPGLTVLSSGDSLDNGFNEGMTCVWGWNYSEDNLDAFGPDDCTGAGYTAAAASVAARYKTDDS